MLRLAVNNMSEVNSNNKRIAKNTIYIYMRTIVVLVVSLYTSRLVLEALGAEDLGIYNVVGGIVALMSFFQSAQTRATSRFITYELGLSGGERQLQKVFSACMTIHILLAVAVVVLGETVGLWIMTHLTDIPIERQTAAMYVYQFSLLVFCIHIIRVPYDAVVIAHEEMSMFAYMSILEAILQLGLVFIVFHSSGDSLILYSGLMAGTALILCLAYYAYVIKKHSIYKYRFTWDKDFSRKVLSFSGWTLLGSGANTATQQGINLLFNNYIGLIANAAMGFAGQVNIAVGKFINGFSTAFTPQIIKYYAQRDYSNLHRLLTRASKFSFALCYLMALPLIINMDFILHLWLGDGVPQYTSEFCQLILICTIIDSTTGVFNATVTATGKIKAYQTCISISFLLDLIFCFFLFIFELSPVIVFGSRIFTRGIVNMFIGMYFTQEKAYYKAMDYSFKVLVPVIVTVIFTFIPIYILGLYTIGWSRLLLTGFSSVLITSSCVLFIIMDKNERTSIIQKIKARKL